MSASNWQRRLRVVKHEPIPFGALRPASEYVVVIEEKHAYLYDKEVWDVELVLAQGRDEHAVKAEAALVLRNFLKELER